MSHTFCAMRAERGVALEIIREPAGHVDERTTQIDVDVTNQRKADGIVALERVDISLAQAASAGPIRRWRLAAVKVPAPRRAELEWADAR